MASVGGEVARNNWDDFGVIRIWPLPEFSGDFSLSGIEVQATQVEKDVGFESFFVPIAKGLFDQPLDFVV